MRLSEFVYCCSLSSRKNIILKLSFYWSCKYFSNSPLSDAGLYIHGERKSHDVGPIEEIISAMTEYSSVICSILFHLHKACPNRLENLMPASFSCVSGVSDEDTNRKWQAKAHLNTYQIGCISLKEKEWFHNDNVEYDMLAYSLNGTVCKHISFKKTRDYLRLFRIQQRGFRFVAVSTEEYKDYQQRDSICDRCINKNGCSDLANGWCGGLFKEYNCFQGLPNTSLKAPIDLLSGITGAQLQ